jgi:hypothetical protein
MCRFVLVPGLDWIRKLVGYFESVNPDPVRSKKSPPKKEKLEIICGLEKNVSDPDPH